MMLKRLASIGLLAVVGSIAAGQAVSVASYQQSAIRPAQPELTTLERLALDEAPPAGLKPRRPLAKKPTDELEVPYFSTGRLLVKFRDGAQVRLNGNGITSLNNYDVSAAEAIVDEFGGRMKQAMHQSKAQLAAIEAKARDYSRRAQPDLAGMIHIDGVRDDDRLLQIARKLNDLDIVEFVEFEVPMLPASGVAQSKLTPETAKLYGSREDRLAYANVKNDGAIVQALNQALQRDDCLVASITLPEIIDIGTELTLPIEGLPIQVTVDEWTETTSALDNLRIGREDAWMTADEIGDVVSFKGRTEGVAGGRTDAALSNLGIHAIVEISPGLRYAVAPARAFVHGVAADQYVMYRVDEAPESLGASTSQDISNPSRTNEQWNDHSPGTHAGGGCGAPDAGHCVAAHGGRGCSNAACCELVQSLAGGEHCGNEWDGVCAALAYVHCGEILAAEGGAGLGGATPDLTTPYQAYKTLATTPGFAGISGGFGGEGLDLQFLIDTADELLDLGIGEENLAEGKTIRVGAIEGAYYPDHEDLDVIPEPGVEMWLNEFFTEPSHGTAVLGIMNAVENDFGMTGIAPDAEGYFFPTFSLIFGGRLLSAIASATDTFKAGDVLNFSIGPVVPPGDRGFECPEGLGVLTSSPGTAIAVALAVDSGIACTISAGNDCCDLDSSPEMAGEDGQPGETGATIVSACTPGCIADVCYCRVFFSNFSRTPNGRPPHKSGWGTDVGTLGYGDLFGGADVNRWYTATFSGTSAAAPMIAGAMACVQGLNKQFFGVPLPPVNLRDAWNGNGDVSPFEQCGLPQPSADLLGSCDDPAENPVGACAGDSVPQDADECPGVPNYIAPFPNLQAWAWSQLNGNWFIDPDSALEQAFVVRGNHVAGNEAALGFVDGVLFEATSQFTQPNSDAVNVPSAWRDPLGRVVYRTTGQVVDVLGVAYAPEGALSGLTVSVVASSGTVGVLFIELYDWDFQRWMMVGFSVTAPGFTFAQSSGNATGFPERFARDSDRAILARAWIWGANPPSQGPGGPEQSPFLGRFDLFQIDPTSDVVVPGG